MTLTRESRTGTALAFAVCIVLAAFVWGNQRLAHAQVVDVGQILCFVDDTGDANDGNTGTFPVFSEQSCTDQGGTVTDWCPNIPGDQAEDQFPQCDAGNGGGGGTGGDSSSDLSVQKTVSNASPTPSSTITYTITVHNAGPDAAQNVSATDTLPAGVAYVSDTASSGAYDHATGVWTIGALGTSTDAVLTVTVTDEAASGTVVTNTASIAHSDSSDSNGGNNSAEVSFTSAAATTTGNQGGGNSPQCSDGIDNDGDGQIDFPADSDCTDANDNDESPSGGVGGGGGHNRRNGGSGSVNGGGNGGGEVLGAETEQCPMFLTGYIKYGASNDAEEVAKLQVFLNAYEANNLKVTGTYDQATLAAVNAFQRKYASDVLEPWGLKGVTGYVYYTTQKEVNTIFCKFQRDFPLSAAQLEEIAYVRAIQPQLHAQRMAGTGAPGKSGEAARAAKPATAPAVGSVVPQNSQSDENATRANAVPQKAATTAATTSTTTASSTPGWFGKFVNWLFGR